MESSTSIQVGVRCKTGIYVYDWNSDKDAQDAFKVSNESIQGNFQFSKDGNYIVVQEKQKILAYNLQTRQCAGSITGTQFLHIQLSSQNKFLVTIDKISQEQQYLSVFTFPEFQNVHVFPYTRYKKQWPLLKFSQDDKFVFRITNEKVLEIYETELMKQIHTQKVDPCEFVTVQQIQGDKFIYICYSLKGQLNVQAKEGTIQIYQFPTNKLIFNKPIPDASEMEFMWSPDGQTLLMQKTFSEDHTGKNYYGQSFLYLFEKNKHNFIELPTYEGPIHNIQWSYGSQEFIVISGFMPAGVVLFDLKGKPQFEFGKDHYNTIIWSPLRRFVILAGFGTLDGTIQIWDSLVLKQISKCKMKSTSVCVWSPCGRKFICSKVTPRLNVDNGYTVIIFDYHGEELLKKEFSELYDIQFRPNSNFSDRPASPRKQKETEQQQPQKKLFIPPGGTGGSLAQMLRQQMSSEGARVLNTNETFGNQQQSGWGLSRKQNQGQNHPPGYVPEEKKEKKKRARKRKDNHNQQQQDNSDKD